MTELQVATMEPPNNYKQPFFRLHLHWKKKRVVVKVSLFGTPTKNAVNLTITRDVFKLRTTCEHRYFLEFKFPRQIFVLFYDTNVQYNHDTLTVSMPISELYDQKKGKKVFIKTPGLVDQQFFKWDCDREMHRKTGRFEKRPKGAAPLKKKNPPKQLEASGDEQAKKRKPKRIENDDSDDQESQENPKKRKARDDKEPKKKRRKKLITDDAAMRIIFETNNAQDEERETKIKTERYKEEYWSSMAEMVKEQRQEKIDRKIDAREKALERRDQTSKRGKQRRKAKSERKVAFNV